jgi:excisionase family DNA binding protein
MAITITASMVKVVADGGAAFDCNCGEGRRTVRPMALIEKARLLFTVNEACGVLHLSRPVVYQLINSGELRSFKVGNARRIPAQALEEYVASKLANAGA